MARTATRTEPAGETPLAVIAAPRPPIPVDWPAERRRREYERRLDQDIKAEQAAKSGPFRRLLFETFDEDTALRLWMKIEPMLNAGKEGVRRNAGANIRSRPIPVAK